MDYKFPLKLFPLYFNSGPPKSTFLHNCGGWGSYGRVIDASAGSQHKDVPSQPAHFSFLTQHQVKGESWLPVEPVTLPLFQPKKVCKYLSTANTDPLDFSDHMSYFYLHHNRDAFGAMSQILEEHLPCVKDGGYHVPLTKKFTESLAYQQCEYTRLSASREMGYYNLLSDVMSDIPPELLASLLHEELTQQGELEQFSEKATGGALCYIPLTESSTIQEGYLLYPGKAGLLSLNFHRVELEYTAGFPPSIDLSSAPYSFQLNDTIRQISIGTPQDESYVGVRSDYQCGVWKVGQNDPCTLEVIQTTEPATCLTTSPHIQGELLVASESGAAHLWTVGSGLQKFRKEHSNLYFNTRSSWRWCDFSAHPRVVVYSDRTGAELTDIRTHESSSYTLFRIGSTPDCKSGERLILSRYLRDVHSFHHLITTQYSAYIMDERFPCIPMIKWDHMMDDPPMFAQALPGSAPGGGATKLVLGSQRSQQLTLLQYSGGREQACCTRGPPLALLRPKDSLRHLPSHLPHRQHAAKERLALPAAGLTCVPQRGDEECIFVLQLTEAGDIFYQVLTPQTGEEGTMAPAQNSEDTGEPTPVEHRSSADTPRRTSKEISESRSGGGGGSLQSSASPCPTEDSESEGQDTSRPELEVVVNDSPDELQSELSDSETIVTQQLGDGGSKKTPVIPAPELQSVRRPSPASVSDEALFMWKKWLLKLVHKGCHKQRLPHRKRKTSHVLTLPGEDLHRDPLEEDRRRALRTEFKEVMRRGEVLVHGTTYQPPLEAVPVPELVEAARWTDELSQRLTASWGGGWKGWWDEKLGANRDEKLRALRRKRRRQKLWRGRGRAELSDSFTSSVTYQSDLDCSSGWSSNTSAFSDTDSQGTGVSTFRDDLSELGTPGASATSQKRPRPQPISSSVPYRDEADATMADIWSTPSQRTPKRQSEDYLGSLLGSQEPSPGGFGEGSSSAPLVTPSQVSTLPSSQRSPWAGPSSQQKRKKSRIGF